MREKSRSERTERAQAAIARILCEASGPLGAGRIRSLLLGAGLDLQPRTIRFHLRDMDRKGWTECVSRRAGRLITVKGREETSRANVVGKVGVVSARVDSLAYQTSYDPRTGQGTVVINTALLYPEHVTQALHEMRLAYRARLGVGGVAALVPAGEMLGQQMVPENHVGVGTICSVTVSAILLRRGIPVNSRFGGLLEIRDRRPIRFVDLIEYRGSTLDPLEVFIRAGMTRVRDVVRRGSGIICASFREVPSVALADIRRMEKEMRNGGLAGILEFGLPNQPLFGIPVSDGHTGMIVVGGLNPIAAVHEAGIPVTLRSLAGLMPCQTLRPIDHLRKTS